MTLHIVSVMFTRNNFKKWSVISSSKG